MKKILKTIKISKREYDEVINFAMSISSEINFVKDEYFNYRNGFKYTKNKRSDFIFDKKNRAIVCDSIYFFKINSKIFETLKWNHQYIFKLDENITEFEEELTGAIAYSKMKKWILQYYTTDEFNEILSNLKPINELREWHLNWFSNQLQNEAILNIGNSKWNFLDAEKEYYKNCYLFKNCYYYDLNSAYLSELCKIFPKCEDFFKRKYEERKKNPQLKKYFNYFVGYLGHHFKNINGTEIYPLYPDARKYIVNQIRLKMEEFIKTNSKYIKNIVYINTDGCILQCNSKIRDGSKELGEFKIEAEGDCKMIYQINYSIFKIGDKVKGTLRKEFRDLINWNELIVPVVEKNTNDLNSEEISLLNYVNLNLKEID